MKATSKNYDHIVTSNLVEVGNLYLFYAYKRIKNNIFWGII